MQNQIYDIASSVGEVERLTENLKTSVKKMAEELMRLAEKSTALHQFLDEEEEQMKKILANTKLFQKKSRCNAIIEQIRRTRRFLNDD